MMEGNALLLGDALREKGFAVTHPQARIVHSAVCLAAALAQRYLRDVCLSVEW